MIRTKKIEIDEYEQGILINALNLFRNQQIRESRLTEAVHTRSMKIIEHGLRNLMLAEKGDTYGYVR